MRDWEDKDRIYWNSDKIVLYLGREDQKNTIIVSIFPAEERIIKDNILSVEAI
jgi:hypothetical protein